jgi:hypothetical protein
MRKPKSDSPAIQIEDGVWYKIAFGKAPFIEECCDCGLTHVTHFKVEDGIFWVRYDRDERRTKRARKARAKAADT